MKRLSLLTAVLCFMALLLPLSTRASEKDGRPRWITQPPVASNNTFEYKVITIDAHSASEARGIVPQEITNYLETSKSVKMASSSSTKVVSQGNDVTEQTSFEMRAVVEGEPVTVVAKIIDEYYEPGRVMGSYYFLVAVGNPKATSVKFDKVQITDKYGTQGLWRSAICPGWGQMYKGSQAKGVAVLCAQVATLGGIVAFEGMRSSYVAKAKAQPKFAQQYYAKASNCKNLRNGFIAGAAAVYVYNLIDAVAASGTRYVKTSKNKLAFYPSLTPESMGFAVAYNF